MAQLTESNWGSSFQNVISNCKTKGRKLERMNCKKGNDMVETYKKFEKDASNKYNSYISKPFESSKRSIGEDMSFYQQQCNSNYSLISDYLKKQCKNFNNILFQVGIILLGIILITIGFFIKNETLKLILNIIGGIILVLVFIKISFNLLEYFRII
jgi:hypothetical protein